MAESPPVQIFPNARDFQVGEQNNYIVNGNQYTSSNGQPTLIQLLQPILDASHTRDRRISPPNSACFPGTRIAVIRTIIAWANSALQWDTHVLWLYGFVGCGKSAIALAIAFEFERSDRLVGSFFFFRNAGDRSRMTRFATTLAFQLATAISEAAPFIEKAVTEEGILVGSSLVAQLRRLVYEPIKAAAQRGRPLGTTVLKGPFLIVIDGLDECEDREDVQAFIDDMLEFFKENPLVPLRFFITSRVEQHIQGHLKKNQVHLENLVNHCSRHDIDAFMDTCFEEEKKRNPVIKAYIQEHGDWPTKKDKHTLVNHIGGSFIFASALFKYIVDPTDDRSTPMERLPHTLNMNPGLDTLYAKTLSRSEHLPHFSTVISTLALLFAPLSIVEIAELLGIKTFEVVRILVNLQAIIHIPGTDDLPVTMCHTSLRDFLTTESRSGRFFASPSHHLKLSYFYFNLNIPPALSATSSCSATPGRLYATHWYWKDFLKATSEPSRVCAEFDQLAHLPSQPSSYLHLFSFIRLFLWLFQDRDHKSQLILLTLTKCIESLASALECDHAPDKWLQQKFFRFAYSPSIEGNCLVGHLEVRQEQAMALQHHVQRAEAAIRAKCPSSLSERSLDSDVHSIRVGWNSFYHATLMDGYLVLKWIAAQVQARVNSAGPGVTCVLGLHVGTVWYPDIRFRISIQSYIQPLAT